MQLCGFETGLDQPLFLIAGPCVIESEQLALDTSAELKAITDRLGIHFIYKSSFDKANRSSGDSFRGLGVEEGLRILAEVKRQVGVPVLVKVSYFPNWTVSGGEGPYRATPSLMVVVPTDSEVTLRFQNTWAENTGNVLTILGLLGLVVTGVRRFWRPLRARHLADA